jgi:hypothetical protein
LYRGHTLDRLWGGGYDFYRLPLDAGVAFAGNIVWSIFAVRFWVGESVDIFLTESVVERETFRGVRQMSARLSLGLSAAAVAWLCFIPDGLAAVQNGNPQANNNLTYSAETVALSPGANTVTLNSFDLNYNLVPVQAGNTAIPAGATVTWTAPGGTWTILNAATTTCTGNAAGGVTVAAGQIICTVGAAGAPFTSVSIFATAAAVPGPGGNLPVATLSSAAVGNLGLSIQVNQPTLGASPTNPSPLVAITAQGPGDAGPIANLTLTSANTFSLITAPQNLGIDLTGAVAAIPPGAGFTQRTAAGTNTVSTAGYLGAFWINFRNDRDARNGANTQSGFNGLFNFADPTPLTGTVTLALTGNFATLTDAYLIPNNNGTPNGNQSACTAARPANVTNSGAVGSTLNTARNTITFTGLTSPPNNPGNNEPVFAICLVTNGNQVIQASVNPQSNGAPAIGINAFISVTSGGTTLPNIGLTTANQGFGEINYLGSVFFAQNVYGAATQQLTFFRAVNQSNTAAPIWAVLTKDVKNQFPESGAGSCNDPGGVTATCNISFVANLTTFNPALTSNNSLSSQGMVQPNTGTYYTADDIATLAGTSFTASSLLATVYLLSPNPGMRFSAITQTAVGGLVQTP